MSTESERIEAIEACRTCGIFYMISSNYLKHIFRSSMDQPDMMLIRLELAQWKLEVGENDGFPQYICSTCIHEFQKIFKFRASCVETQGQFRHFRNLREENHANIKVKTEMPDPDGEKPVCDFIYVDDLSDTEYDGMTPFNIPPVPIKEELIEAAAIPMEESVQSLNMVESASRVVSQPEQSSLHVPQVTLQNENVVNTSAVVATEMLDERVRCKLCQHISSNNGEHKQHLQRAHEIRNLECHICGKEFKNSTQARLKFHMKWHTLNKHVKCTVCGFVCNSKDALNEHKRANHSKTNCKICGKGILEKKMKSHLRNHELIKYPCEYCTETFSTENEREYHIWQLHANEDSSEIHSIATLTEITPEVTGNAFSISQGEDILCSESQAANLLSYKFTCAHCEEGFAMQIDLETHVNEAHRPKTHVLQEVEANTAIAQESTTNNGSEKISSDDILCNEGRTNIAIFKDYDNDNEVHTGHEQYPGERDLIRNSPLAEQQINHFIHSTPTYFPKSSGNLENEEVQKDVSGRCDEHTEYHNETASNPSESGDSSEATLLEEENDHLRNYSSDNLKPFSCAKCTETFATIEQLRQHHEQHLVSIQKLQQQNNSDKLKFKCNLCGKAFDLKFSLNRHVKKHKYAPV